MSALQQRVVAGFRAAFGREPDGVVRAPGRVNLIGEHTDYNDGFVLPCAIDVETRIAWSRRDDDEVHVVALEFDGETDRFTLTDIEHYPGGTWREYIRAMVTTLVGQGEELTGANLAVVGDIPRGAGLSSSASLEVAVGHAMHAAAGLPVDAKTIAIQAQTAENDFVGMKCGNMDQLASAASVAGAALMIDCRSLDLTPVPIPDDATILIIHSGVIRGLVEGHYNKRREECEEAAAALGVPKLRDATLEMLEDGRAKMSAEAYKRARHIISENARVLEAADRLAANDLSAMGELMWASHVSMRDDFQITVPKVDELAATAHKAVQEFGRGEGGARMTGGGFGGAIVALCRKDAADAIEHAIRTRYRAPDGQEPFIMVEHAVAGAGPVAG